MSQIVRCPSCEQPVRLPVTYGGESVRCPACGKVYDPPPDDQEDAPLAGLDDSPPMRDIRATDDQADVRGNLRLACVLQLVSYGVMLLGLGSVSLFALAQVLSSKGSSPEPLGLIMFFGSPSLLLSLMSAGMWAQAPVRNGARGLAVAVLAVTVIMLLLIAAQVAEFSHRFGEDRMFGSVFVCEWTRHLMLAWMLFALANNQRRAGTLRALSLVFGILVSAYPIFLLLLNLSIGEAARGTSTGDSVRLLVNLLLVVLLLVLEAGVVLGLFIALGRQARRD